MSLSGAPEFFKLHKCSLKVQGKSEGMDRMTTNLLSGSFEMARINVRYSGIPATTETNRREVATLDWSGRRIVFFVSPFTLACIQEITGLGVFKLYERMANGAAWARDAEIVISEALHASGYASEAEELLDQHVRRKPIADNLPVAMAILGVALFGRAPQQARI